MKTKNWENIKWIFEPDGALRDIYIQNVGILDWKFVVGLLNAKYKLTFGADNESLVDKIDLEYIRAVFADQTGELERKSATIDLDGITVKCYFFLHDQIEFDIHPAEIHTEVELEKVMDFMKTISAELGKQITLCSENQPEFPLIKIDVKNGVEKILTEQEAESLWKKTEHNASGFTKLKSEIIRTYFPKIFKKRVIESANKAYTSTPKEKNLW